MGMARAYKLQKGDPNVAQVQLPRVELLVGLLTVPAAWSIRARRRDSWLGKAHYDCSAGLFEYRFVLSTRESFDSRLLKEAAEHEDILFVDAPVGFDYISYKVKLFVDWAPPEVGGGGGGGAKKEKKEGGKKKK